VFSFFIGVVLTLPKPSFFGFPILFPEPFQNYGLVSLHKSPLSTFVTFPVSLSKPLCCLESLQTNPPLCISWTRSSPFQMFTSPLYNCLASNKVLPLHLEIFSGYGPTPTSFTINLASLTSPPPRCLCHQSYQPTPFSKDIEASPRELFFYLFSHVLFFFPQQSGARIFPFKVPFPL